MGKVLETFRQATPKVRADAPSVPLSKVADVSAPLNDDTEADMPFIEVGGRNESTQASADVMAATPRPGPLAPIPHAAASPVANAPGSRPPMAYSSLRNVRLQPAIASPQWVFFSPHFAAELITQDPGHPISAQYKIMFGQILDALGDKPAPVVYFLGAAEHSGTTTTVLNLALIAAHQMDRTVTVVEGNSRRPAVAQRVGLETQRPELAWLQARKPANLRFVPWPQQTRQPVSLILEMLRADEGLILIDGPNLKDLSATEASVPCDGLYVVARDDERPTPTQRLSRDIDGWIIAQ